MMRDRVKELLRVRAADIHGAVWNWREHSTRQTDALAASIEELGFIDPLDVFVSQDGKYTLVDGHARRDLIDARIGPDTLIPVIVTDLSEAEAKKANLVKDPLAAMAGTNQQALEALRAQVEMQSPALEEMLAGLVEQGRRTLEGLAETIGQGQVGAGQSGLMNGMAGSKEPEETVPDFQPVGEDEQVPLDEKVKVKCPECGHAFLPQARRCSL